MGVCGVHGFIPVGLSSTGSYFRGFMEYRVSFQGVYGVKGLISRGLWCTGSHFRGFMVYRV